MEKPELIPGIAFTPTQIRILDVLADGEQHKTQELLKAIDDLADTNGLAQHMSNLRSKIYASGYLIAAHSAGKAGVSGYQLVQRLRISME